MPSDFKLENKNKNQNNELKPKLEAKNNKNLSKLESIEKILKKVWDDPRGKFSISAFGTLTGMGLLKLIYDAVKNNKTENGFKLTPNDIAWIKKNMILFAQKFPLCWHNVFMQLLACPEYIYYSSLPDHPIRKSKKIMTMIDFSKSELNKEFTGNFLKRKIKVPLEVRQMPDDIILKLDEINNQLVPEDDTLDDSFKKDIIRSANSTDCIYVKSGIGKLFLDYNPNIINSLTGENKKFKDIKIPNNVILKYDDNYNYIPEDDSLDEETKNHIIELANYKFNAYITKNIESKFILNSSSNWPNKTWLTDTESHAFVLNNLEYVCDGKYLFDNIKFNELGILDVPDTEYCESDEICGRDGDEVYYVEKPINEADEARVLEARRSDSINEVLGWYNYQGKEDAMKYYTRRAENILLEYGRKTFNEIPAKDINCCQKYGYYPTFVVIFDNVDYSSVPHYHCCYIVYDKNKKIKYFLWGDGCESGFRVMPANKSLEKLNKYSGIWVKYSRNDIVEKFYTP